MTRWWKVVAVLAAWLGAAVAAQAQYEPPSPVGAARMVEPYRTSTTTQQQPDLVPHEMTPLVAPIGPPANLDLPSDHPGAFQFEQNTPECAWFGSAGGFALQRFHPGSLPIALEETPQPPTVTTTPKFDRRGMEIGSTTTTTPNPPLPNSTVAEDLRDFHPGMFGGVQASLGYLCENELIEVLGMYQPKEGLAHSTTTPGPFFVPFTDAPPGFNGSNSPWRTANFVTTSYQTTLTSAEVNYRYWNPAWISHVEVILGARYFYTLERLSILSSGADSSPTDTAAYSVGTRNNIAAPQVGFEYSTPCILPYCGWLWFSGIGKAAVGPNCCERNFSLIRADGLQSFNADRWNVQVGEVYELNASVDMHILERLRLRIGYQALWAVGISNPANQANFDLASPSTRGVDHSSAFWHGPMAELQFLW